MNHKGDGCCTLAFVPAVDQRCLQQIADLGKRKDTFRKAGVNIVVDQQYREFSIFSDVFQYSCDPPMHVFSVRKVRAFQMFGNRIQKTLTDVSKQIVLTAVMIVKRCAVDARLLAKLTDGNSMKRHPFEQLQEGIL